jgi:hypothetical protein
MHFKILDQSKLLGVVFNDVKPMLFNTYFNRGYYHYGVDSRYLYSGNRKSRTTPKNYLNPIRLRNLYLCLTRASPMTATTTGAMSENPLVNCPISVKTSYLES